MCDLDAQDASSTLYSCLPHLQHLAQVSVLFLFFKHLWGTTHAYLCACCFHAPGIRWWY